MSEQQAKLYIHPVTGQFVYGFPPPGARLYQPSDSTNWMEANGQISKERADRLRREQSESNGS